MNKVEKKNYTEVQINVERIEVIVNNLPVKGQQEIRLVGVRCGKKDKDNI